MLRLTKNGLIVLLLLVGGKLCVTQLCFISRQRGPLLEIVFRFLLRNS